MAAESQSVSSTAPHSQSVWSSAPDSQSGCSAAGCRWQQFADDVAELCQLFLSSSLWWSVCCRQLVGFEAFCERIECGRTYSWVCNYACPVWHPGLTKKLSKDIEQVQKRCLKLCTHIFCICESLNKSGLDHLDFRRDLITKKTYSEKLKIQSTHSITYYLLLKCPIVKWFCGLHTCISFHLAKPLAMDVILYHTAFLRSFRDLSL